MWLARARAGPNGSGTRLVTPGKRSSATVCDFPARKAASATRRKSTPPSTIPRRLGKIVGGLAARGTKVRAIADVIVQ